jgi:adenylosuccinate synthase
MCFIWEASSFFRRFFYAKSQYIKVPGWKDSANKSELKPFVDSVQNFTGVPVEFITNGVNPDDIIKW